jgi:hypothetical protein
MLIKIRKTTNELFKQHSESLQEPMPSDEQDKVFIELQDKTVEAIKNRIINNESL